MERRKPGLLAVDGKVFSWYFRKFPPQQSERVLYDALGIRAVKFLNPNNGTLVNRVLHRRRLDPNNREQLEKRIQLTKKGERDHIVGGLALLGIGLSAAFLFPGIGEPTLALTSIAQVPLNIYPIMLQRYNRLLAQEKLDILNLKLQ